MNFPPLSIPDLPLPIAIPEMMHPAIIHFAVALPVIIILLELINLAVRRKLLGSISFVLMVLMALVYLGAYLTGTVDANRAKDLLSPETKALLDAHKNGGIWLVYGSLGVILLKIISVAVKKILVRIVYLLVLVLFFWGATGVVQDGCALTYKHGVNVQKAAATAASAEDAPAAQEAPKAETATEKNENKPAGMIDAVKEKAAAAAEAVKETAADAAEAVKETTTDVVEKAGEMAETATEAVQETASEATHQVEKAVDAVTQPAQEAVPQEAAQEAAH